MKNKKLVLVAVLLCFVAIGSVFAAVGIGLGPQWNGAAGSGATILFNENMIVNIGFPYGGYRYSGAGLGLGFDYLFGQHSITDFGSGGFVDFGWHWGVGGALNLFFDTDGHYYHDGEDYHGFGFAIGALPIVGLDLGFNITSEFKINLFLQYQPVLGVIINRPGFAGPFWFEPWSFAGGLRFHF